MNKSSSSSRSSFFSSTAWLKPALLILLLMAIVSAAVIYSRLSLWRKDGNSQPHDDSSIFVAPIGILDMNAKFSLVDGFEDSPPPPAAKLPDPVAPIRLLDQDWKVSFSGI